MECLIICDMNSFLLPKYAVKPGTHTKALHGNQIESMVICVEVKVEPNR